ncbi:hypothetical protein [Sphaerotilus uruguayifluvii]|uniref:NodB homology domain-containing protein n=1 Tax=Sphaerotilus uruguayifluvii TaxID=2735897 RepID=A0ABX2FZN5_9BURK|nr:hypothetical protein [Leptothrix sp. C29]NRT55496.1 hypothetical protein [Leptothrix sp. C29]
MNRENHLPRSRRHGPHAPLRRPRLRRLAAALALGGCLLGAGAAQAAARDTLVLLVPDDAVSSSWPVKVWTDSAAEQGLRMTTMTDSQFLALGTGAAAQIAGLIVPDSAHIKASDAVVAAVRQYANLGGRLMLVYDAGALTPGGFYAPTKSRFSDVAGVDYTLYDTLLDRVVGFGPVVGTQAQLDALELPPGKYAAWSAPVTTAGTTSSSTLFVAASTSDPGATTAMRPYVQSRAQQRVDESSSAARKTTATVRKLLGLDSLPVSSATRLATKVSATPALSSMLGSALSRSTGLLSPLTSSVTLAGTGTTSTTSTGTGTVTTAAATSTTTTATTTAATDLQAISGYGYGALGYFSYVTQGSYSGTVLLSSPDHGVVAGRRSTGSGSVLFVNLPLGYFKAIGTDSAPLHGFLNLFAREQVQMPMMSTQPKGVGGLVYNWHVDDGDDLTSDVKALLDTTTVLQRGPFSIHFTAGPDTVATGDGLGMKLDTSTASQTQFNRLKNLAAGHELASHGGWNHDLYGLGANETNQSTYQPWLELNFAAVDRLKGKASTEYSAPMGNNPTWAVNWLEGRKVVGMYFVGDTGSAPVRSWRSGSRLTSSLWSFPIVPMGKYATFEEFDEFGVTDAQSGQWLLDLQTFAVNHRTTRLFYNHPPGARGHLAAINPLLTRADSLRTLGQFNWYTMTQMANFSERRLATGWSASSASGLSTFTATHPSSLADMTWLLPRARYGTPLITSGSGRVGSDTTNWVVTATAGTTLKFTAAER